MRIGTFTVVALGLLAAACGTDTQQRAATGGLTGLGIGALVGGPVGAVVGAAIGGLGGWAAPEGADQLAFNAIGMEKNAASGPLNEAGLGGAVSGTSTPPAGLSADQIRGTLMSDGYDDIRELRRQANDTYTAEVERDDQTYRLRVDARTGRVITQRRLASNQPGAGSDQGGDSR
jgi:hypothetical protein